jgi:Aromatic-ring-opening dioxygenase LigAB, LigA subunit
MTHSGGELSSFLTRLHEDPELQKRYKQDPRGTLEQAGVSKDATDAVLSGDLGKIKSMLGGPEQMLFMVVIAPDG